MTVLSLSFLLGMAVALSVYFWWRVEPASSQFHQVFSVVAMIICPPYVLSFAVSANPESQLALVLTVGTIVFANGFLYSGVAASGYFIFSLMAKKKHARERQDST